MPSLGADMDSGTLLEWLVKPGDEVHKGDIVAVVDTDKAAVEVECFESGVFGSILVEPGTTVPVGAPLGVITPGPAAASEAPPGPAPEAPEMPAPGLAGGPPPPVPAAGPPAPPKVPATPPVRHLARQLGVDISQVHGTGPDGAVTHADVQAAATMQRRPRVTPFARRLAAELGIDLTAVRGTGPGGAIRAADVRHAAPEAAPEARAPSAGPPPGAAERAAVPPGAAAARPESQPEAGRAAERRDAMRRAIGNLMTRSKREIPHYYLSTTIDLEQMTQWLRSRNRELPVPSRIVPAALLLKAAALAAREVPQMNGFWLDDHFVPAGHVHLGVAISLRDAGMVAPAIHDADTLTIADLMARLRDLVTRARTGRLRGSEMTDPTITVTNLGDRGVETVFGVIYPPQVALAGFGKVVSAPYAADGLLGVRSQVTATLAADHRASDGYTGARYLEAITRLLQKPEEL